MIDHRLQKMVVCIGGYFVCQHQPVEELIGIGQFMIRQVMLDQTQHQIRELHFQIVGESIGPVVKIAVSRQTGAVKEFRLAP